ncbi:MULTISPECIES: SDR family oxidoreductase [Bacillus]|uniref:SDR family oxidoreductase n=1 Tax=Bacillus paranthracis TaxID=2026186 RepID=A0AAX3QJ75_9BACI|nr:MULTISPECIES: SDR family oxidoreductase [Bacillus cereus group]PWN74794.1 NADH-flavin reductase [Bacillus cereus]MBE7134639.1 SDR family oxidoreductase [Bacillus paranthracis]MBE7155795.1 SDR family oxidoreductase [Bacillus paranthracis]MDA1746542.1 SDR family oxidoreductase [Bacillus cereus group sp. LD121LC]MDA2144087.1 SDR family oxidoreductase [Bacillus cereus group sp. Bc248]
MESTNKIAILGANGKAGKILVNEALEKGYQVKILTRNSTNTEKINENIETIIGDARNFSTIQDLLQGCSAVINAVGQPKNESYIFSTVTKHIIEAMKESKIKRYILISGGSLNVTGDQKGIVNKIGATLFKLFLPKMMQDKYKELQIIQNSEVDWTIVRLPFVIEGNGIGSIKESLVDMPGIKIQNGDIAPFVIKQINSDRYVGKCPFISN